MDQRVLVLEAGGPELLLVPPRQRPQSAPPIRRYRSNRE
jgi:hypothetical protein